jgi:pectin methylesterase-like acyl-CoA thioesterase
VRSSPPVVLVVDQSPGKGHYTTIQAAINAVPANGGALIKISPGTYRQVQSLSLDVCLFLSLYI